MRTKEEILARVRSVSDLFGTQVADLVEYLPFEAAKEFLNDDYKRKVEAGEEKWEMRSDPKAEILDYLEFAYGKAEDQRGLSAGRSMLHFKTWIWLDDDTFYSQVIDLIDNYTDY